MDNMPILDTKQCFENHIGMWAVLSDWMQSAYTNIMAGTWKPMSREAMNARRDDQKGFTVFKNIAIISISGPMQKPPSKFGGTSTVLTRRLIRQATADKSIAGIMIAIDSPGGHVDGTKALADEINIARKTKPVHANIEDLGASAAYWVASQTAQISANEMAMVGSIGTFTVLQDLSGKAEREGVKIHVISTGKHKGAGMPGTELSEEYLEEVQGMVNKINGFFLKDVRKGRSISSEKLAEITDGRVFLAKEAKSLGLIDSIMTLEQAVINMTKSIGRSTQTAKMQLNLLK